MEFNYIKLKTGQLIVPKCFVLLREFYNEKSAYAGVVADYNGGKTHYVVFSDKPIQTLNEYEQDEITDYIKQTYRIDESSVLGIFAIPEVAGKERLFLGTGIIRG